ncbi:tetratricopeptide repeat-containing diguanylate cyclase [Pseudoalteromonas luteoviolacea]|uniref:tetratricopeptide repeat-containing diguanylate cyclase n=1 Tax=Pseudoalteromonas luteoviolacea TaxID=43657 RepID=UPI001B382379|nr:tetratricopeptide repeat-containing diguanylate cyclase [Pseudoalteromonas luteoviolacea]MBQ4838647.1 diguanylate cyclase [Pseudoalteromonas luteoviolacea]
MRFYVALALSLLLFGVSPVYSSTQSSWQQTYDILRAQDTRTAFDYLVEQVNITQPSAKRVYIGATLTRTALALKQGSTLNTLIEYSNSEYDVILQHLVMALISSHNNEYEQTMQAFKLAITRAYTMEDPALTATVELFYINAKITLANYIQLDHHIQEVERNASVLKKPFWGLNALQNAKALNANFLGDHALAIEMYQQVIANSKYEGNKAPYYNNLALTYLEIGNYNDATKYLEKALMLRKAQKNQFKVALAMLNLGIVANKAGNYDLSLQWLDKAYQYYVQSDNAYRQAYALVQKAKVYTNTAKTELATQALDLALSKISVSNNINLITDIRLQAAENMRALGQIEKAVQQATQAKDLSRNASDKTHLIQSLELLSDLYAQQSNYEQAYTLQNQLITEKEQFNSQRTMQAMIALESELEVTAQQLENIRLEKHNNLQLDQISQLEERQQFQAIIILFSLLLLFISLRGYSKHKYRAQHDNLTGALTRSAFLSVVSRTNLPAIGKQHCLVLFDLDHFKQVNDVYGHPTGDRALKQTALLAKEFFGSSALLSRFGGEEFMLFLPNLARSSCVDIIEQFRVQLSNTPIDTESGEEINITASFSSYYYQNSPQSLDKIYSKLDVALYQAKKSGRNRVVCAL